MLLRVFPLLLILISSVRGHHDVEATVAKLSAQIVTAPTTDLYYQRATEYRSLRKPKKAIADLRAALKLDSEHALSIVALVPLLLDSGEKDEALALAIQHLDKSASGPAQLAANFLCARVYVACGKPLKAIELCAIIDREYPDHDASVDLFHARALRSLGSHKVATAVLKKAWLRTKSVVLRNQWIDAALTVGDVEEALPIIEAELADSRFKSSWLIRRARVHLLEKRSDQAKADLHAALQELTPRIKKERPDLTLVADRGLANLLLGNQDEAKVALTLLQNSTLPEDAYHLLQSGVFLVSNLSEKD